MPTFKHPCPHCGKYIERDVKACPFCGTADPFAPGRCPNCNAIIDDPAWKACPKCGQPLPLAAPAPPEWLNQADAPSGTSAPAVRKCTGCGAPLPDGAKFCTVCGTLAA